MMNTELNLINEDDRIIILSQEQVLKFCGLVSDVYALTSDKQNRKIASELLGVDTKAFNSYRYKIHQECVSIAENTLKQLQKQGLFHFDKLDDETYVLVFNDGEYERKYQKIKKHSNINHTEEVKNKISDKMLKSKDEKYLDCVKDTKTINKLNNILVKEDSEFITILKEKINK